MGNAARLLRGTHFTNVQALMPRRHASNGWNAEQEARGQALLSEWQGQAADRLGKEPQARPIDVKQGEYAAATAMLGQMRSRMTDFEVQFVLQNPVEGVAFMTNEVRYRAQGAKIAPLDPAVAGALDSAMLGPGVSVVQRTGPDGRPMSELVKTSTKPAWYRKADGTAIFHNVRPSEVAAAAAGFRQSTIRKHAATAGGVSLSGPPSPGGGVAAGFRERDLDDRVSSLVADNTNRMTSQEVDSVRQLKNDKNYNAIFELFRNVIATRPLNSIVNGRDQEQVDDRLRSLVGGGK